ncbi:MAG TPA: hypothetical protein VHL11_17880, partial [Phototrophicaceae bacterium]|nr:hypothetical protein [Phototrophicaceae bacterium]
MATVTVTYVPLDQLKALLGLEDAADTLTAADEERLKGALRAATAQVEQIAGRRFAPRIATIYHAFDPHTPTQLLLDDDLLQLLSITNGDGQEIAYENLEIIGNGIIRLRNGVTFNTGDDDLSKPIAVEAIWGWHDHPSEAWRLSGDEVAEVLDPPGIETLSVNDADGIDPFGNTPRFCAGQLLRISLEFISIIGCNSEANSLSVVRGVLGSLTTDHSV